MLHILRKIKNLFPEDFTRPGITRHSSTMHYNRVTSKNRQKFRLTQSNKERPGYSAALYALSEYKPKSFLGKILHRLGLPPLRREWDEFMDQIRAANREADLLDKFEEISPKKQLLKEKIQKELQNWVDAVSDNNPQKAPRELISCHLNDWIKKVWDNKFEDGKSHLIKILDSGSEELPDIWGQLNEFHAIREIVIDNSYVENKKGLTKLPQSFSKLKYLKKLDLSGNQLTKLPDLSEENGLKSLKELRIVRNPGLFSNTEDACNKLKPIFDELKNKNAKLQLRLGDLIPNIDIYFTIGSNTGVYGMNVHSQSPRIVSEMRSY